MGFYYWLTIITGISFIFYGISCLVTENMKNEFIRFELAEWRVTTGYLQLLGGLGLLIGAFYNPLMVAISATGLSILMLMGFITRLRIKDGFIPSSPAFIFMLINALIAYTYF